MSPDHTFDVAILGGGPGGYVAGARAGQLGLSAAVIEKDKVGGECLHRACIPAKALLRIADLWQLAGRLDRFAISASNLSYDWPAALKRKEQIIGANFKGVQGLLKQNKVTVFSGRGRITGPGTVEVQGSGESSKVSARHIILATGSQALDLPMLRFGPRVCDTAGALSLPEVPKTLAVIGAGASGLECASLYGRLGSQVTVIEMAPQVLPGEDAEIAEVLEKALRSEGITLALEARLEQAREIGEGVNLHYSQKGERHTLQVEQVILAVGRRPSTADLGLEAVGIAPGKRGFLEVDATQKVAASKGSFYAIGDIVATPGLAHVASAEAMIAVGALAGAPLPPLNPRLIPRATYCHPPVAGVGLTEQQAREQSREIRVGRARYSYNATASLLGERDGLIKMVSDSGTGEILGVSMVGYGVTELIAQSGLAMALEATPQEIATLVHAHPTLSESVMEAARSSLGWAIHG